METEPAPAFFLSVCDGDTVTVRKMLSTAGAQSLINYQDTLGATPLLTAAANGHESVTKQLLEARCNVDLQMQDGESALYIAAKNGYTSVTKQLIAAHCNVDVQVVRGFSNLRRGGAVCETP